jgi:dTDP-4-amino-4,6-dideoxygalactose transaminase
MVTTPTRPSRIKTRPEDLAIHGSQPAFDEPLYVGRPNIPDRGRLQVRLDDLLDRRRLTNGGPYLAEFESRLADLTGAAYVVAMCNATLALELTVQALGWQGEVILPSFTFIATAHAVHRQGLTPIFCDVDARTHNLDPRRVEAAITPRTSGIVGVHVWGRPCAVEALQGIAVRHGLGLVFDAAHALGCSSRGRPIGGFGEAEVFSFHATKMVNTFEGGAVATNSSALAERLGRMRDFGFEAEDRVTDLGTNAKMSEVCAAMGLGGLESMDDWIAINRRNHDLYRSELEGLPGMTIVPYDATEENNYQYLVVEVDEELSGLSRDLVRAVLRAENVLARRYFFPGCHRMEPYRSEKADWAPALSVTERLTERVLALPTGTAIGGQEIETIAQVLRLCWQDKEAVRARLDARPTSNPVAEPPGGGAPWRMG